MKRKAKGQLTRAITHIALHEANRGKLAALDAVWEVYRPLCEAYISYFCTQVAPDPEIDFVFASALSSRWQRVAVQQAAGIAQSWHSNRANHLADYEERLARYTTLEAAQREKRKAPIWTEPQVPRLHAVCIQANVNVVQPMDEDAQTLALQENERGKFDYWLRISTLEKGKPIYIPVLLSTYHKEALGTLKPNSSVTLNRRKGAWWLTLTTTQPLPTPKPAIQRGTVGVDIGIRNTLTDSTGKHYGSFSQSLLKAHEREKAKRQRKAKLRACLEKKGRESLPSLSSASGQRLARRTCQEINFAVNRFYDDHAHEVIAAEALSIAGMRFKSHRMNGVLKASNLGHIVEQLQWNAVKRGVPLVFVQAAYSSQECPRCHHTARANRPNQQTFCCIVCGFSDHADVVAAGNLEQRLDDPALAACRGRQAIKDLLDQRHREWCAQHKDARSVSFPPS